MVASFSERQQMFYGMDSAVTAWLNGLAGRSHALDLFMMAVTQAAIPLMVIGVVVQWWPGAGRHSERHVLVGCGLSFLLGLALNQVVLLFVHRVRPYDAGITHLLIAPSVDPSFPSDHSTAAFAIVFGYLLNGRLLKATLFGIAALLLVASRIYLGVHYAGDIVGGCATAFLAAVVVRSVYLEGTSIDRRITGLF
jgi:undecaprenyl-diphosphatase